MSLELIACNGLIDFVELQRESRSVCAMMAGDEGRWIDFDDFLPVDLFFLFRGTTIVSFRSTAIFVVRDLSLLRDDSRTLDFFCVTYLTVYLLRIDFLCKFYYIKLKSLTVFYK